MTALALLSLIVLGLASTDYAYGWARKDFDNNNAQLQSQGYLLMEVNAYVPPGATDAIWNGIWKKVRGNGAKGKWSKIIRSIRANWLR